MSEHNKAIVSRYYEEVWNLGRLEVIDKVISEHFMGHRSSDLDYVGPESIRDSVNALCGAFPDGKFTIDDVIAEGDKVAIRFTVHATHMGPFRNIPPTGKQIVITGMRIYRIVDEKIVERWECIDQLGLMQQLSAIPSTGK